MNIEDRIALHRRMAEAYRDAYRKQAVQEGATYAEWQFADHAEYSSPYFTCNEVLDLSNVSISVADYATTEAKAYTVRFPDWGPAEFKCWPAENGFVMKTRFEGTAKDDGTKMTFHSYGFVETDEQGLIKRWETHVNGEEYGPFLERAIGVRGPFPDQTVYHDALTRTLKEGGF
ncbi:MAG TPA: hypothetical protein VLH10_00560 [Yinghuangia sp.]|nr:hypothetical protein [Yinghuangia sp.]